VSLFLHFSGKELCRAIKVASLGEQTALSAFRNYLKNLISNVSIITFNGLGFNNTVLVGHFFELTTNFHAVLGFFKKPLPCLKEHFTTTKPSNFKLGT
jgi:hypothetical protein